MVTECGLDCEEAPALTSMQRVLGDPVVARRLTRCGAAALPRLGSSRQRIVGTHMSDTRTAEGEDEWQRVRRVVLGRDDYRCRDCHEPASLGELDVHHLIRRADGGR